MPLQHPKNTDTPDISIRTALGVIAGHYRWLISMEDISQVLQVPKLVPVPLTHSWFLGITNVRGHLYGVTDLSGCLGATPTPQDARARILLISPRLATNTALLVRRILGIRNIAAFEQVAGAESDPSGTITGLLRDKEKRIWRQLSLHHLAIHDRFIRIAL